MVCANCGKTLTTTEISEDQYYFCNTICRYTWRQKGKPNPYQVEKNTIIDPGVTNVDMDFHIEPLGFENRNIFVRVSFWGHPKLFVDGERLKPIRKSYFKRYREYNAVSNYGNNVNIRLYLKGMDYFPRMKIEGQEIQIARRLTKWE